MASRRDLKDQKLLKDMVIASLKLENLSNEGVRVCTGSEALRPLVERALRASID